LGEGRCQRQRLVWLSNGYDGAALASALAEHGLVLTDLVDSGDLVIRGNRPVGMFDNAAAMEGWALRAAQAVRDGYTALRVASEVPPPIGPVAEHALAEYEFLADRALALSGSLALCGYDVRRWPTDAVELAEAFHGARHCSRADVGGTSFTIRAGHDGASIAGEVDTFDATLFTRSVPAVSGESDRLVLDLTRLTFVDAGGLTALARAVEGWERAGQRVALHGARPVVRRCWSLLGFDTVTRAVFV
ncbi:MAG TPA: MEDS domain-containing protein, partial [Acidimicrobiia bacterium]|nr:MEDS domain-containing protein [Acidimicrobiia bacterium]